jgi:hypothetical protein
MSSIAALRDAFSFSGLESMVRCTDPFTKFLKIKPRRNLWEGERAGGKTL